MELGFCRIGKLKITKMMGFRIFSYFLLYTLSGLQVKGQCEEEHFRNCNMEVEKPLKLIGANPVFTTDQILQSCGSLLDANDCLTMSLEFNCQFSPISNDALRNINICRLLKERYVHQLDCYTTLNATFQNCLHHEQSLFPNYLSDIQKGNRELQSHACCNIRHVFDCILTPTRENESCNDNALATMKDFLNLSLLQSDKMIPICEQFNCTGTRQPTPRSDRPLREKISDDSNNGPGSTGAMPLLTGLISSCVLCSLIMSVLQI